MVLEKIRAATSAIHKELDEWLMPVFKNAHTVDHYIIILKSFYGFWQPVFNNISLHIDQQYLPDFNERRKPDALMHDVEQLTGSSANIEYCSNLPRIDNDGAAWGSLYVFEGSSLGGIYLSKLLAQNMNISEETGLSFFYGYGQSTRQKWEIFIQRLNQYGMEKKSDDEIVRGAVETFQCFKIYLQQKISF